MERRPPVSERMSESDKNPGIDVSLPTLLESVRTLQTALQTKAKNEPAARFYSLWDKVCRIDVLHEAYRRCRANRGAPGADGERFEHIEDQGLATWLERLQQELRAKTYRLQPLLRVWIPKANGGERPLGIPCIRDRVVETAVLLVIGPIFEAAAAKHPDLKFVKVDTDAQADLASQFGIQSIPTLGIFKDKELIFLQPGALPEEVLEEIIAKVRTVDMKDVRSKVQAGEPLDED